MKKNSEKGFTLMEMLIVIAIIAVLVAVSLPVFSGSTMKARKAADEANLRVALAQASAKYLNGSNPATAETPKMQTDGDFTFNDVPFRWDKGEIVTVTVDQDGVHQG